MSYRRIPRHHVGRTLLIFIAAFLLLGAFDIVTTITYYGASGLCLILGFLVGREYQTHAILKAMAQMPDRPQKPTIVIQPETPTNEKEAD